MQLSIDLAEQEAIRLLSTTDSGTLLREHSQGALHAIQFLGSIRSIKAIPCLCDHLLHWRTHDGIARTRFVYPASDALVKIGGTPVVEGLLRKIATCPTSPEYRRVALEVIEEITGVEKVEKAIRDFRLLSNTRLEKQELGRLDGFLQEIKEVRDKKRLKTETSQAKDIQFLAKRFATTP